ncbi:response regulator transcription factor [Geosporobacter ferrireducens]|uniref:response regulator transcription factor n=1 Tax=Geosporobacter ferrireducens TaxID=1424294 RepID=UPI00139D75A5|nr:response regulator [Geosporobacter ferrireducens]MTI54037.1 response regulator [Geosporobacter ferrireducens]
MIHLMIVDDEPLERKGLEYLIEKYFKNEIRVVQSVSNGNAAIEGLEREAIDLVLMDIQMPIMDGLQASKEIKSKNNNIEIIILTAFDEFEYAKKAIHIGVNDYLLKPIANDEFLDAIERVLLKIKIRKDRVNDLLENELLVEQLINLNEYIKGISELLLNKDLVGSLAYFDKIITTLESYRIPIEDLVISLKIILKSVLQDVSFYLSDFDIDTSLKLLSDQLQTGDRMNVILEGFLKDVIDKIDITRDRSEKAVVLAKEYIKDHFNKEISLEEVAEYVDLNPHYFSKLFKKIEGKNFKDYLIELRMEIAKELLKTTKFSIKEIAYKVGYNDANYFSRAFKRYTGRPATKYH